VKTATKVPNKRRKKSLILTELKCPPSEAELKVTNFMNLDLEPTNAALMIIDSRTVYGFIAIDPWAIPRLRQSR
jgi:hypothetical protein